MALLFAVIVILVTTAMSLPPVIRIDKLYQQLTLEKSKTLEKELDIRSRIVKMASDQTDSCGIQSWPVVSSRERLPDGNDDDDDDDDDGDDDGNGNSVDLDKGEEREAMATAMVTTLYENLLAKDVESQSNRRTLEQHASPTCSREIGSENIRQRNYLAARKAGLANITLSLHVHTLQQKSAELEKSLRIFQVDVDLTNRTNAGLHRLRSRLTLRTVPEDVPSSQ
uniref:Uncharacterized protein n=1 Tax=Vespula pensylvanica TaxID=30213 RepID=A0A834NWR9_VESPE|nr:hypothetical protein H0235_010267 [Vespula pensylvanica]